jgi:uncharacterized membrane protein YjjP (DUF1212 family)
MTTGMFKTTKEYTHSELGGVLRVTMRFGVLMLRSGAASFRTDESMRRLAESLGVGRLDAYVTPTGVIATAYSGREHRTQIMKVPALGVDMNRVVELEMLSRRVPPDATPEQIEKRLDEIEAMGSLYKRWQIILAVGLACGGFALIIGGGPLEFIAAVCGASAAQTLRIRLNRLHINPIPVTAICAALATAISFGLAQLSVRIGPALGLTPIPRLGVIASVLLLVPGVPLVSSIIDITHLDLVSSTARGVYAMVLFVSIGIGMLIVLAWTGLSVL